MIGRIETPLIMKAPFVLFITLCLAGSIRAQAPAADLPGESYSSDQLDSLLAPIALYPDPLVALILPASTAPGDITLAEQYVAANGDPAGIDSQSWDPSVKALARYTEVLKWMNDNLDWTQALGAAFTQQPADVMKSIQQLRARARAAGTLVDTPQQQVDMEGDDIRIVPAQADIIYVPQYDPDLVYDAPDGYAGPFLTFGVGFPVGAWLGYECDWDDFGIWAGPWHPGWAYRRDWRDPRVHGNAWRPDPRRSREVVRKFYRPAASPPRPSNSGRTPAPARRPVEGRHPAAPAPSSRPDYRGWGGPPAPRAPAPAPSGALFGNYGRGTEARAFSNRGETSRQAPVRSPGPARTGPAARPAAHSAPPPRAAPQKSGDKRDQR